MKPHAAFRNILALLIGAVQLSACTDGVDWSARERDNAAHIHASLRATSDAAAIANRIDSPEALRTHRAELLTLLRAAHLHAARVEDSVLDKLHPRLYAKFRVDYQHALAQMIRAYEQNDVGAAQEAASEIVDFMTWYRQQTHTFRWWEQALARESRR